MQGYNCIIVYNENRNKLLFCKRTKEPYQGLYNLVGGKIDNGEDGFIAAYRELYEEIGIGREQIKLSHMMDFTYYNQECYIEVYVGVLKSNIILVQEAHPLVWLDINENFYDTDRFAGEGNIGHMIEQVRCYGLGKEEQLNIINKIQKELDTSSISIGVDGCKGGWIAAVINEGKLIIDKYIQIDHIVNAYPNFDEFLVDMVIGLQSTKEHIRPDSYARKIIRERASTIFPAPSRQAVYANSVAEAYNENERILGKKFTPLTVGIIPKMKEIDLFLQNKPQLKNKIKESHPEVCFAKLNGGTVLSKKSEIEGFEYRLEILSQFLPNITKADVAAAAKRFKCNVDDIIDAICLAVTANIVYQGNYDTIPNHPMKDETGLLMQMVIPK